VLHHRRAAGHDLGQRVGQLRRVPAVDQLVEVGVAVEVVEVLEQGEVERLLERRVGLAAGQPGREVDGDLLVADRRLERALVAGVEVVDHGPLLLVDAPGPRQRPSGLLRSAGPAVRPSAGGYPPPFRQTTAARRSAAPMRPGARIVGGWTQRWTSAGPLADCCPSSTTTGWSSTRRGRSSPSSSTSSATPGGRPGSNGAPRSTARSSSPATGRW